MRTERGEELINMPQSSCHHLSSRHGDWHGDQAVTRQHLAHVVTRQHLAHVVTRQHLAHVVTRQHLGTCSDQVQDVSSEQ